MGAERIVRMGRAERGPRDHLCSLHHGAAEYQRRAAVFFAEGLREGLRVAYLATDGMESARAELAVLGDGDRLVADGFRGLRMSADVTGLVRTPEQQDAFARYEFLADQYMADHPLSGLCGYSVDLGEQIAAEVAALHAAGRSQDTDVRIFGCSDGALGLAGEFDLATVPVLSRVLARLRPGDDAGVLVVDMAAVDFVDHRLLIALADHARSRAMTVSLRSAPQLTARLLTLLSLADVHLAEQGTGT